MAPPRLPSREVGSCARTVQKQKEGEAIKLTEEKKGKLYLRLVAAAAVLIAVFYSYSALASIPSAIPGILADNQTLSPDNVSIPGDAL